MSFAAILARLPDVFPDADERAVARALTVDRIDDCGLAALLSPAARPHLETMAQRAQALTLRHFGRAKTLFTPLYLADACENDCRYCGFSARHRTPRSRLTRDAIAREADHLAGLGFRHVLMLTGDARSVTGVDYLGEAAHLLAQQFSSVGAEIYALTQDEYVQLVAAGADALTIYQETYDRTAYAQLHTRGPKADYDFRLDAPARAAAAGMQAVTVGVLLGLHDWRSDVWRAALHAQWLERHYPGCAVSIALPRLRPEAGGFAAPVTVTDGDYVQALCALRLFLPHAGLTLSTRERAALRDRLLPLGITRLSAASSTAVGGHTAGEAAVPQFSIADERSLPEVMAALRGAGYEPVLHDWVRCAS